MVGKVSRWGGGISPWRGSQGGSIPSRWLQKPGSHTDTPSPFLRGDTPRPRASTPLSSHSPLLSHNYVRGSITLYIINLHRSRKKIKLAGTLRDKIVHQYLLQPYGKDGLHSK